jgi:hypothetical protein
MSFAMPVSWAAPGSCGSTVAVPLGFQRMAREPFWSTAAEPPAMVPLALIADGCPRLNLPVPRSVLVPFWFQRMMWIPPVPANSSSPTTTSLSLWRWRS